MTRQHDYANSKVSWALGLKLLETHKSSGRMPALEDYKFSALWIGMQNGTICYIIQAVQLNSVLLMSNLQWHWSSVVFSRSESPEGKSYTAQLV